MWLTLASVLVYGAELRTPPEVTAGTGLSIASSGSGKATFYLIGPGRVAKRQIDLGGTISVGPEETQSAGRYVAIVCGSDGCASNYFYVSAAKPEHLSFLLHPSRVPVSIRDAINATAFVFDKFHNPVLAPATVEFRVTPKNGSLYSRINRTDRGVAWIRLDSTPREGPVKVTASLGQLTETRMVQQVASDACDLRIKVERNKKGVLIQTEPVRDCSGNPVPDGTVVSFTVVDTQGKTTVDAPIKKGIARTELPIRGSARISVASGVVTGNEIALGEGT